jgi:hypothetical protein
MSQAITIKNSSIAVPAKKTSPIKGAATKDAGRVHVGGAMMRFKDAGRVHIGGAMMRF